MRGEEIHTPLSERQQAFLLERLSQALQEFETPSEQTRLLEDRCSRLQPP